MTFKIDHNDTCGDGPLPVGEYEVYILDAKMDVTQNGVEHISLELVVRDDVNQDCKKAHLWEKLWKGKETGQYNMRMINSIGKALKIPNGKEYQGLTDLLADFKGKYCRVKVKHEEYKGYTNARVAYWQPSALGPYSSVGGLSLGEEIVIDDEYCPF